MKFSRIPCQNHENHEDLIIPCQNNGNREILIIPHQNHENHEIHKLPRQNHENYENSLFYARIKKIIELLKFLA